MITTPNLGLKVWNLTTDPYDSGQLADNWARVDEHDHASGRGKQIPTGGIEDGAITVNKLAVGANVPPDASITDLKLAANSVTESKLAANSVTADKLSSTLARRIGVSQTGTNRSVTVTQTAEVTTNTLTPGIVVGTSSELDTASNGVLEFAAQAELKSNNASGISYIYFQLNNAGTWVTVSAPTSLVNSGSSYIFSTGITGTGTNYIWAGGIVRVPFITNGILSNVDKSQFRVGLFTNNASYTAYVRNLTATMTYIS